MIKYVCLIIGLICIVFICGCGSTTKITEYDPATGITKTTETKIDPTELIIQSTQNKTVLVTREVYAMGLDLSPANFTIESILSLSFLYSHKKTAIASIHSNHNIDKIKDIFEAMQKTDRISVSSSGISTGEN